MITYFARHFLTPVLAIALLLTTGCSINHPVAQDYHAYLDDDKYPRSLPQSELGASYTMTEETRDHRYEFRAASVGYAHLWIVEFGKILEETLSEDYVQEAFGRLDATSSGDSGQGLMTFDLESYEFKNSQAYVTMKVILQEEGKLMLDNSYSAIGVNQAGKMWGLGPFAMTNSTLQSTKFAIDDILTQLIEDLNELEDPN